MRSLAAVVVMLAGCESLYGVQPTPSATDAARADAAPPDAFTCHPQPIHDDFTGTAPCSPWGMPTGSANTVGGGMLVIEPTANPLSQGGCASAPLAFEDSGVFIKVASVLRFAGDSQGGTFMFFETRGTTPADGVVLNISVGGGLFFVNHQGAVVMSAPYDPVQMAWWRIRPDRDLPGVVGDVSPDGVSWQTIGSVAGTIPTSLIVDFTAGEYGVGVADAGTAIIEHFNICP